ncbi:hypothetical protein BgiMline_026802 [Biomphalaria glabrata]|nr:hypothetical protein BgiMline_021250 [Biomphalaria glabrata]
MIGACFLICLASRKQRSDFHRSFTPPYSHVAKAKKYGVQGRSTLHRRRMGSNESVSKTIVSSGFPISASENLIPLYTVALEKIGKMGGRSGGHFSINALQRIIGRQLI